MSLFIREIHMENWPEPEEEIDLCDYNADIYLDLKTGNNDFSVWSAMDCNDIDDAIAAYLASNDRWAKNISKEDVCIENINIVYFSEEEVKKYDIEYSQVDNNTDIENFEHKHYDFHNLKVGDMNSIIMLVMDSIGAGNIRIITKPRLDEIFSDLIKRKLITDSSIDKNHGSLRKYVEKLSKSIDAT